MQSNFKPTNLAFKVAALFTSAAITTVVFGSQLGLAEFYASKSDPALVAERVPPVVDKAACTLPVHRAT